MYIDSCDCIVVNTDGKTTWLPEWKNNMILPATGTTKAFVVAPDYVCLMGDHKYKSFTYPKKAVIIILA